VVAAVEERVGAHTSDASYATILGIPEPIGGFAARQSALQRLGIACSPIPDVKASERSHYEADVRHLLVDRERR
jgi:hypothetical protein